MKYQFTNEEIKVGDYCIFVWMALPFSDEVKFQESNVPEDKIGDFGSIANIPVIVDEITPEFVTLRPFTMIDDGKACTFLYDKNSKEPLVLQLANNNEQCPRLIKSQWAKPRTKIIK